MLNRPTTRPALPVVSESRPDAATLPRLVLLCPDATPVEYPITEAVVIGRSAAATIQLNDREVSRRHTHVEPTPDGCRISDLGSSNGTFLNGRRLNAPALLNDGDEVLVGSTRLVFRQELSQKLRLPVSDVPVVATVDAERTFDAGDAITDVDQLRRDYERLRLAHNFQRTLGVGQDLHSLLGRILDVAFDMIPAENGVILLRDDRTNELVVEAVKQRRSDGSRVLVSDTLLQHVAAHRRGILTSDALGDARFASSHSIVVLGVRSCMAVPLLTGSDVRGVMFLDTRERVGAFTPKDLEVLSAIATQASVSIENQELVRRIAESAQKRVFLERFLSPQLASEVENGRIELSRGGQLQDITVLFADIRGFTSLCEHGRPEDTVVLLNEYFELVADCVFTCDGIVDKFIGDAVMALFGAPVRGTDDAARAVRCARLMMQKTHQFNELRRSQGRSEIRVGIGLHTGEAIVGVMGSTRRLEYTAIGDTVNVASRLCDRAGPGEIVMSDHTRTESHIADTDIDPLPPLQLKGRSRPLDAVRIPGRTTPPSVR